MLETSKIKKWGNSQGIIISKKILEKLNLNINDEIIIEEKEDCIQIKKSNAKKISLKDLFKNYEGEYEKENLDWDNEVGKEVW